MRTVKIFFLTAFVFGFISMIGCSKSSNNTPVSHSDSVYSSSWITLAIPFNSTDSLYEQTISAPAVTAAILDNGVVLGYGAYLNASNDTVVESAIEFDLYQTFSVGSIFLQSQYNNQGLLYRYVVVPGDVLATTKLTPQQLKSMNYTEVTGLLRSGAKTAAPSTLTPQ